MYAIEKQNAEFETYGHALWWTAMRVITAGSDAEPITGEGRALAFLLALFGYAIFGYVTATIASFFIGRDAQEANAPVAESQDISRLQKEISTLTQALKEMQKKMG